MILVKWTYISDCSILESAAKDGFSVIQNVTICSLLDNRICYWSAVSCWFVYFCDFLKNIKEPYLMESVETFVISDEKENYFLPYNASWFYVLPKKVKHKTRNVIQETKRKVKFLLMWIGKISLVEIFKKHFLNLPFSDCLILKNLRENLKNGLSGMVCLELCIWETQILPPEYNHFFVYFMIRKVQSIIDMLVCF